MEKELKIIPPIGYEIDRQKSTFEKIIFKKIPENPKTWEEYCSLMKGKTVYYTNCNTITVSGFSDATTTALFDLSSSSCITSFARAKR